MNYIINFLGVFLYLLRNAELEVRIFALAEYCQHFLEFIEADELMFVVKFVDASQTAKSAVVTLFVEA